MGGGQDAREECFRERTWSAPSMTVEGQAGPRSIADSDKKGPGDH